MKSRHYFWSLMALPLLAACSSDIVPEPAPGPGEGEATSDGVYISLTLNPNSTTRSTTTATGSSDGEEVGTDVENAVTTAMIVLADTDNRFIAYSMVNPKVTGNGGSISSGTLDGNPMYQTVAKFSKTNIGDYYETDDFSPDINVFVFCNPTSNLQVAMQNIQLNGVGSTDWTNLICKIGDASDEIWGTTEGKFTMSNVSIAKRQLPANIDEWSNYSTAIKAFDLSGINSAGTANEVDNLTNAGPVKVERMAARMDFRDGSQMGLGNGVEGVPFTYNIVFDKDEEPIVQGEILSMALVNVSKTEYYLGRTSKNGLEGKDDDVKICGPELPWFEGKDGNYVVSTNSAEKRGPIKSNFSTYFSSPFFASNGLVAPITTSDWKWDYCADVVKNPSDNYGQNNYHVWRYLSENTIPSPNNLQMNGQSTGVVFNTRMLATEKLKNSDDKWEKMLYYALSYDMSDAYGKALLHQDNLKDPILYSLSGTTLYVTWENVREAALSEAGFNETKGQNQNLDRKSPLYLLVFGNGGVGKITDDEGKVIFDDEEALDTDSPNYAWMAWDKANRQAGELLNNFKKKATANGFTLYQSNQDQHTGKWGYYCFYYYWNRHNDNGKDSVMGPMEFGVVRNNVYKLAVTKLSTLGHPRLPENDPEDPTPDTPDEKANVYLTVKVEVVPWAVRINNINF